MDAMLRGSQRSLQTAIKCSARFASRSPSRRSPRLGEAPDAAFDEGAVVHLIVDELDMCGAAVLPREGEDRESGTSAAMAGHARGPSVMRPRPYPGALKGCPGASNPTVPNRAVGSTRTPPSNAAKARSRLGADDTNVPNPAWVVVARIPHRRHARLPVGRPRERQRVGEAERGEDVGRQHIEVVRSRLILQHPSHDGVPDVRVPKPAGLPGWRSGRSLYEVVERPWLPAADRVAIARPVAIVGKSRPVREHG
jgi:hypothetical protein